MAFRIIKACKALTSFHLLSRPVGKEWSIEISRNGINSLKHPTPLTNIYRHGSFFNRTTAEELWKGATHVRNAGRKRGRTKTRRPVRNLNRGQTIGVGKVNMVWPGLNSPVVRGREIVQQQKLPEDPEREKKLFAMRDATSKRFRVKLSPLERGWSGGKPGGRSIGPPDPINDEKFEGFDSRILEFKLVMTMSGVFGRKRTFHTFVVTGNKNGLAGISVGKGADPKTALRIAKNRAGIKLMYIDRHNEHTVFHDFYCRFGNSRIMVKRQSPGYGLVCHRAIKSCCEVIGIKDLYAKVEGATNVKHIIKAFFIGLLQQKSHEQIAEDKKLHLVQFREDCGNYPVVLASPAKVRTAEEIPSNEILDFTQYIMGGKVIHEKPKYTAFYKALPSWTMRLRKTAYLRNKEDVRIRMFAEHGELRSFYTDKYPEAKPVLWSKSKSEKKVEED